MNYIDREFYSEFGLDVEITLPENYFVVPQGFANRRGKLRIEKEL